MKYLYVSFLITALHAAAYAQSATIGPQDMRYSSILPGPASIHYQSAGTEQNRGFLGSIAQKPGYAFLASAAMPGLGQAANQQWWKTGIFLAVEAAAIGWYIHKENVGRSGERKYERFANENWSVVAYAHWLVETYDYDPDDLLTSQYQGGGIPEPAFDNAVDWDVIDIAALREIERRTPYEHGTNFSHDLPDYGSQQYYELVSKYFQYGPGWHDWWSGDHDPFNGGRMRPEIEFMTDDWLYHADIGYRFNSDLNTARNMLTLIVVNHFISAFDAYFTNSLRSHRLQASASMRNGPQVRLTYNF